MGIGIREMHQRIVKRLLSISRIGHGEQVEGRGETETVSQFYAGLCETVEESVSIFTVKIHIHDPLAT